jgi:type IV pilus assembly protein PilM
MGGGIYNAEIQKQMAVNFETAEELKTGRVEAGDRAEKLGMIMRNVSNLLATEAQRSYNFFSATYPDRLVTKVFLTGGAARSLHLREMLAEKIGVEVEIFDPFQALQADEKTVDPAALQNGTAATVAVGLALRNLEERR